MEVRLSESPTWLRCSFFPLQVIENCAVTGIRVRTDDFGVRRVAAVETEHGSIQTPCVVNCAGWNAVPLTPTAQVPPTKDAFLGWEVRVGRNSEVPRAHSGGS